MLKICDYARNRVLLNRPRRCIIVLGVLIMLSLCYKFLPDVLRKLPFYYIGSEDIDFHLTNGNKGPEIIILMWTAMWRQSERVSVLDADKCSHLETGTIVLPGSSVFDVPCRITYDRRYLSVSNALVFHSYDVQWDKVPNQDRNPNQLWIYQQRESPIYTKLDLKAYSNTFNWTMTYRRDSDVYHPYGHLVPISQQPDNFYSTMNQSISKLLKSRTKLVAWIVSSCDSHSKREYFVHQLQKYITVDVLGGCGQDCPSGDCYNHVKSTHKFYLSFENSLCTDYITEKFFNALKADMVPVVYGGGKSLDYSSIAPKNSYIDARSFTSPKDLATFLLYLDKTDEEYLKFFEWKSKYQFVSTQLGWCNLCQKVYEHVNAVPPKSRKWYKDLWKWWNYMSYDTSIEVDEQIAGNFQKTGIGQSYYYKLGAPACLSPINKFTSGNSNLDFKSGFLNGGIFGKLMGWLKDGG